MKAIKQFRWTIVLAYAGFIFYLSSRPWPSPIPLFFGADKVIHLFLYCALGFSFVWACRATRLKFHPNLLWIAVLMGIFYGAADEFHQSFVPGRTCSEFDLLFDTIGSLIGAWIGIGVAKRLRHDAKRAIII